MRVFAQLIDGELWNLLPTQIIMWAAAVAAATSLLRKLWRSSEFLRRLLIHAAALGTTTKWPNGSTDLPSSLTEIYRRQSETLELVKGIREDLNVHVKEYEGHISLHRG